METTVFVVSDLHLGGKAGFEMCSAQGQQRLAELFGWIAKQALDRRRIELVIAGDIVDFLAVEDKGGGTWSSFTANEAEALRKLDQVVAATAPVWEQLRACTKNGCVVTLMLGNHDIELSFPAVRHRFLEHVGPGKVEFLYDNEAYTRGKLLIEHGNRYDGWNVVDHDALRRMRSQLSRGVSLDRFPAQPGSDLVVKVMNKLKEKYSWVDLLKPETSGVIPILATLGASMWSRFGPGIMASARAAWRDKQFGGDGMPTEDSFISERTTPKPPDDTPFPDDDIENWVTANTAAAGSEIGEASGLKEDLLFRAIRKWGEKDGRTFAVEIEDPRYTNAAATLARRGFELVIFGHTHNVKRIALGDPAYATYFNTGTWADLIRIPPETFGSDATLARSKFGRFFDDLKSNNVTALRRLVPTFARVELDADDNITHKDLYFFDGPDAVVRVDTPGVFARLS